jgi:hypothetical protein
MWALGGKAFLEAQQQALRAMREGAAAMTLPGAAPGACALGDGVGVGPPGFPNLAFDAGEIGKAGQALADLWASANDLTTRAGAAAAAGAPTRTRPCRPALRRIVDPRVWLGAGDDVEEALQRMAQGPRLADLWDTERRYAKVFQAWMTLRRRGLEHQAVVLQGWTTAARRFADRLAELSSKGEAPATQRTRSTSGSGPRTGRCWRCSAPSATSTPRRRLLKASTELRLAQQEVAEYYGQMFGLPTRTELDDVHKSLTEMRRELRATQRQLRAASAPKPAPVRPAAAASRALPCGAARRRRAELWPRRTRRRSPIPPAPSPRRRRPPRRRCAVPAC